MTRHKHSDVIHAWADGAEIQEEYDGSWFDEPYPCFEEYRNFRIKPRTVKREGWAVIYKLYDGVSYLQGNIYYSKESAEKAYPTAVDAIKIEWEESL